MKMPSNSESLCFLRDVRIWVQTQSEWMPSKIAKKRRIWFYFWWFSGVLFPPRLCTSSMVKENQYFSLLSLKDKSVDSVIEVKR